MPIIFEDEDEYLEGMDIFTEQIRAMGSEAPTIGTDLSTSVTLSERTRALSIQRSTPSNGSLSPMDVDSGLENMQVDEAISPAPTRRVSPTGATHSVAVPSKRPTDTYDRLGLSSPSPSPSALPQPAKRHKVPREREPDFGCELEPFLIAHDSSVQPLLDEGDLAWGTIYEIARGITKKQWAWSSVTREKLAQLRGTNAQAAPRVAAVMHGRVVPRAPAEQLWFEYDREQEAIMEGEHRGLGGKGAWKGKENWYGGQIQQVGRLVWAQGRPPSIQLEKPEVRRSHRFSRYLGSRRILQVRVADDLLHKHGKDVRDFLSKRKFVLCGRTFLPFHAKEGGIYMVETNLDYERVANSADGDQYRPSLAEFIKWHNPWNGNHKQPISKWSTRWALGLSTSIPTIKLKPSHIKEEEDICVNPNDKKPPAEECFTDGCGYINGAALTQIMKAMGYASRPTAVQGRLGGSKGMWMLHPELLQQVPEGDAKIWTRPSQTKIKKEVFDDAWLIFDLLAPSRVFGPSHLSSQTLINLSYNGIDHQLLKELMSLGMQEEIQPFIEWTQPHSMIMVWKAVEKAGKVIVSRLRRQFSGQARALGLGQLRPLENQDQESEDLEIKLEEENDEQNPHHLQSLPDSGHKSSSGQPHTLHESVLELIQAGFHPLKLDYLFNKLEIIITLVLDDYLEKFHIPIMESCEAYIVPDPYGVLEEGQIHFKSSEPIINHKTGEQTNIVLGDVLVSRNPTRLPSDVQKVKAIAHSKLGNYFDVIVFPIKGKQTLASYLGGGDYDGDTVMLNWNKSLVEQFRGSPLCSAPANLSEFFERTVESVRAFDNRLKPIQPKQAQQELQNILLLGAAETKVGLYSNFHDSAVYECGYGSPEAIRLAYMFTTCLDASKTGLRVKEDVFKKDQHDWISKKPWYKGKLEQGKPGRGEKDSQIPPKLQNGSFILDVLMEEGEKLRKEALQNYKALNVHSSKEDQDLNRPWNAARTRAAEAAAIGFRGFKDNLADINSHVEEAQGKYQRAIVMSKDSSSKGQYYESVASFFAEKPHFRHFVFFSDEDVQTLKASCAATKSLTFAFSVAFRDLCAIKSRATGNIPVAHEFAQCMTIPSVVTRTLSQVYDSLQVPGSED